MYAGYGDYFANVKSHIFETIKNTLEKFFTFPPCKVEICPRDCTYNLKLRLDFHGGYFCHHNPVNENHY